MKIFISADMEGVNGLTGPEDVIPTGRHYQQGRERMTAEVNAAAAGLLEGGAEEIVVIDAHEDADNLCIEKLHPKISFIRGGSRNLSMVEGIDETFQGFVCLGYHAKFGTPHAVMDHTYDPSTIRDFTINGVSYGELGVNSLVAASYGVPLIMATGDAALTKEAKAYDERCVTVAVKEGIGRFCAKCLPLQKSLALIQETAREAALSIDRFQAAEVPKNLLMGVTFQQVNMADCVMKITGVERTGPMSISLKVRDMKELMYMRQVVFYMAGESFDPRF